MPDETPRVDPIATLDEMRTDHWNRLFKYADSEEAFSSPAARGLFLNDLDELRSVLIRLETSTKAMLWDHERHNR